VGEASRRLRRTTCRDNIDHFHWFAAVGMRSFIKPCKTFIHVLPQLMSCRRDCFQLRAKSLVEVTQRDSSNDPLKTRKPIGYINPMLMIYPLWIPSFFDTYLCRFICQEVSHMLKLIPTPHCKSYALEMS
jgi:hypothetical protein